MTATLPPIQSDGGEAFKKVTVSGYTRVSTTRQHTEGLGLPIQEESIRNYCHSRPELELVQIYTDAGISGSQIKNRPALLQLLDDAKAGKFKLVIVPKLDRLARNLFVQLFIEKELLVYGVEVISLAESFSGKDPMMVAMRQIVGVFAELEKGRITERLLSGRMKKLQNGGYAGGQPAYGFTVHNGMLVINENEAAVVRRIKQLRDDGCSYRKIAKTLNEEGFKPRQSISWDNTSVRFIHRNKIYVGKIAYGKTVQGIHAKIL